MTDMPNPADLVAAEQRQRTDMPNYRIDETYWGYVVHKTGDRRMMIAALQFFAMFFGACFLAVALGLLVIPSGIAGSTDFVMRAGAAAIFVGFAAVLLFYASRGLLSEIQVDNTLGEVREVVRNRAGRSTLIGRHCYDAIGAVVAEPYGDKVMVSLRFRNTDQVICVAIGTDTEMTPLRARIARDMIV